MNTRRDHFSISATFSTPATSQDIRAGNRTLDRWFNTDGFNRTASRGPAAFHARVFPTRVEGVRADMTNHWNANIQRNFRIKERLSFQVRLDAINAANRSQLDGPDVNPYSTDFGRVVAQTRAANRWIQIQGRIRF